MKIPPITVINTPFKNRTQLREFQTNTSFRAEEQKDEPGCGSGVDQQRGAMLRSAVQSGALLRRVALV